MPPVRITLKATIEIINVHISNPYHTSLPVYNRGRNCCRMGGAGLVMGARTAWVTNCLMSTVATSGKVLVSDGYALKTSPHFELRALEPPGFNRVSSSLNRFEQPLHSMTIYAPGPDFLFRDTPTTK